MRVIMINGPAGSGKSWISSQLKRLLNGRYEYEAFKKPLIHGTMTMLGLDPIHVNYDVFKRTDYHGKTGREWMISLATCMRGHDDNIYPKMLLNRMELSNWGRRAAPPIFVLDDLGFESEFQFMRVALDVQYITACISPVGDSGVELYAHGQKYPDDSRFCLSGYAAVKGPNSSEVFESLCLAMRRRNWI